MPRRFLGSLPIIVLIATFAFARNETRAFFPSTSMNAFLIPVMDAAPGDFPLPRDLKPHPEFPDPTLMVDGSKVKSAEEWKNKRVPELKKLFEHYMYGRYPADPSKFSARVRFQDSKAFSGKGTLKEVEITFGPPEWPKLNLLIASPNLSHPVACFVGPNFAGNHLLSEDMRIQLPLAWVPNNYPGVKENRASEAGRGKLSDSWPLEKIIARGYAVATFYCGDIQPDRPDVREGMRATLPIPDPNRPDLDRTGSIQWWAWGVHRAIDYLVTNTAIDPKRLAVVGHSRLGKAALLAGAYDSRIAVVIPHQAGCGGSGPSRHSDQRAESIDRIAKAFPHWFCDNFKSFGGSPERLPFDQNCLVAICAPRPVLFTNATDDLWANPSGQFEILKAAEPAYKLMGVDGLAARSMPAVNEMMTSRLGYWIRPGKHEMAPTDWQAFMNFGDRWLK